MFSMYFSYCEDASGTANQLLSLKSLDIQVLNLWLVTSYKLPENMHLLGLYASAQNMGGLWIPWAICVCVCVCVRACVRV